MTGIADDKERKIPVVSTAVEVDRVSKAFGATRALQDVSLRIAKGTIHSLVGQNGAGKPTLIAIIEGAVRPDSGEVKVNGRALAAGSPNVAREAGIAVVHQELALFPDQSVAENVAGTGMPTASRIFVRSTARARRVQSIVRALGAELDPRTPVGELTLGQQQLVEIARAVYSGGSVLVLDEPTSALTEREIERLHETLRALAKDGTAIIFVSHRLSEVLALSDDITVMRDGHIVRSGPRVRESSASLVAAVTGVARCDRQVPSTRADQAPISRASQVPRHDHVAIRGVKTGHLGPVSFDVRPGEILGIAGLTGSGAEEILQAIGGAASAHGSVSVWGETYRIGSIRRSRRHRVILLPADRATDGLWLDYSLEWNLACGNLRACSRFGIILDRGRMRAHARRWLAELDVSARGPSQSVWQLSGGTSSACFLRVASRRRHF